MTAKEFEKIVKLAFKAIPQKFLKKLSNVDICIEEEPTPYQAQKLKEKKNSLIFGLYEGIPQTRRRHYGQVLPDKITIFKKPIEEYALHTFQLHRGGRGDWVSPGGGKTASEASARNRRCLGSGTKVAEGDRLNEVKESGATIDRVALEKEIKEIVKNTVWHEIAHHFGMDEREVRKAEKRRG